MFNICFFAYKNFFSNFNSKLNASKFTLIVNEYFILKVLLEKTKDTRGVHKKLKVTIFQKIANRARREQTNQKKKIKLKRRANRIVKGLWRQIQYGGRYFPK